MKLLMMIFLLTGFEFAHAAKSFTSYKLVCNMNVGSEQVEASSCVVNYQVGSSEDSRFAKRRTRTIVLNNGQMTALNALLSKDISTFKSDEGI